jgi:lipoprotein signal peptidase
VAADGDAARRGRSATSSTASATALSPDFIKLPGWPAFNVADIAITFGVVVLLYVTERPRHAAASDT